MLGIKNITLKLAMAKANVNSTSELSRLTNISRNSLTKYATAEGIQSITLGNLLILCNALNCKIEELVEMEDI